MNFLEGQAMNNTKHLNNVLNHTIKTISNSRSLFVFNPESDFIRKRKLDFETVLKNIICMESGSLKDELFKLNNYSITTPSTSAFVQARSKIKVDAFKSLFDRFNKKTSVLKTFKGYRLLAIDCSELPIDNTVFDEETTVLNSGNDKQPYFAFHLNASYDLLECTYNDLIIQGQAKMDENDAFYDLVDRYAGHKAIFIADRNYESYNSFEHVVHSGNKYLIRVKDITTPTGITKSLGPYPDQDEFDIDVFRMLTLKQTKIIKTCSQLYKFVPSKQHFDYMDKDNPFYEFNCRIIRFKITEDSYEYIITNLDREEFSIEDIKKLYHMRWDLETSFREVKYAIGLNALHSKKRELIKQEIYARLTLYNLCQRIVQEIKIEKKNLKYKYQVNFTRSFHIIRHFLKKKGGFPPDMESMIAKEILPIRPGRTDERKLKPKSVVSFNYRFD